jgi:hypothetical protein
MRVGHSGHWKSDQPQRIAGGWQPPAAVPLRSTTVLELRTWEHPVLTSTVAMTRGKGGCKGEGARRCSLLGHRKDFGFCNEMCSLWGVVKRGEGWCNLLFFFLSGTGIFNSGPHACEATLSSPFFTFSYFSGRGLCFCPESAWISFLLHFLSHWDDRCVPPCQAYWLR